MNTVDILIEGRNFPLLLDRLKKRGVKIYKITQKKELQRIIRVSCFDSEKVFAICQNMWYNKKLKRNGFIGVLDYLKRYLPFFLFAVIFTVLAFVADGYVFKLSVNGASQSSRAKIFALLDDMGVETPCLKSEIDGKEIEKRLYQVFDGVDFVTVKKSGNRLIIDLICGKDLIKKSEKTNKIIAKRSGVITRLGVYSGTCLKQVGDSVVAYETIAEGFYVEGEGENQIRVETDCKGSYDLTCQVVVNVESTDEDGAIFTALLSSGIDQACLLNSEVIKVGSNKNTTYTVTLTYLFTERF